MQITAIILAQNEEHQIQEAIRSVSFCEEILVIDDISTDKTLEIAKRTGAKVISHESFGDFASQRNFALRCATYDWVLFLDADERISDTLKKELNSTLFLNESKNSYFIKRRDFFWGKELKWGETYKARNTGLIRLIHKNKGSFKYSVHERFISDGLTGRLNGYINHFPHQTIKEFVLHINRYSSLRAQELFNQRVSPRFFPIIYFPLGKFIFTYFVLLGFLDGPQGFVYSFLMSFHSFLVRTKLYFYKPHIAHAS